MAKGTKEKHRTFRRDKDVEHEAPVVLHKLFRVAVLGNTGVGKTCLIERFVDGAFNPNTRPTLEDTYEVQVKIEANNIQLHLMDSPGHVSKEAIVDAYIRRADGFLLVYSITDEKSFAHIETLLKKILHVRIDLKQVPVVVIANKSDLKEERVITEETSKALVEKYQVQFREFSVKADSNVALPFVYIAKVLSSNPHNKKRKKEQEDNLTEYLKLATLPSPI